MEPGFEARPSTAGSSGLSEASTPETRDHTPPIMVPKREPVEVGLGPQVSRRHRCVGLRYFIVAFLTSVQQ